MDGDIKLSIIQYMKMVYGVSGVMFKRNIKKKLGTTYPEKKF